jgi:NAD(P)-dependent dehydrogenase (short-subunit alcohol dehydrogenase family)
MTSTITPDLEGTRSFITGRGTGSAAAVALARLGSAVAVTGRTRRTLDETVSTVEAAGGRAIAAGLVDTPLVAEGRSPKRIVARIAAHPIDRIGRPEEIADAIVWLRSDQSSFVTGVVLLPMSTARIVGSPQNRVVALGIVDG